MAKRTLFIRNIEDTAVDRLQRAAAVRQLTMAEYIEKLVDLHDVARARAKEFGDEDLAAIWQAELTTLGLQTITG